ncbi:LPS export ABC transporter permease LptF [Xenorhabdus hominickii]|uniref:Lipopolysaccharide export system permease protein LptF n=1 Tax=Xenorhabdus hominickii TaxID=351679 RepID=A0A2G0QDU6_XENHO|nr:LPS export ABC transporter permease LptF [Xenorhabdus hominickii]AOM41471.1 lipopolysaccharide ABC transporter permease LptF [Xenorhabdus hominickii]PHM57402.1 lipopolysaccharide ABC transporter permease LptF [Xenorhabdus hominickii]
MIIIRYLVRETLKSQIAILFILLLIFFSQKLVEVLGAAVEGNIPANLVLSLLGLGVPDMAQLILPLSLFLGVLMTFSKLYTESEITVMHACGLGKGVLVKSAMILALLTSILAAANVIWFTPWSSKYQAQVLADAKANPSLAALMEGQFKSSSDSSMVLYVGDVKGNSFENVFLAQLRPANDQRPSVVIADGGHMEELPNGNQIAVLHEGTRYEGTAMLRDFRITDFKNYQAVIGHQSANIDNGKVEQKSITQLWHENDFDSRAEFHWRLTLIVSVLTMALMVVPLSVVNPRQGRILSMLPAMLLYLIFFLLQSSLRSNGGRGKLDPMLWMWLVNGAYFALALFLNVWDTVPMRKLRSRFKTQGAA